MNMIPVLIELSPTDKVPGIYLKTLFGRSNGSTSPEPQYLLLVGLPASDGSGSIVADSDVLDVFDRADANRIAGAGSELARMCYAALDVGSIRIKVAAPSISGATAATATITIDGTWTTAGEWIYRLAGIELRQGILSTDTPATLAPKIAAYITARAELPASAVSAAGSGTSYVITLTAKSTGVRGKDLTICQDKTGLPSGMTSVLAGGGAALGNGGKRFGVGAGVEDVATLLDSILFEGRYHRIAAAQNDATALGKWVVHLDQKADPTVGRMEHLVVASSAALATAKSRAQTTMNEQRAQLLWMLDSETHPSEIAAKFAAMRLRREQQNPNQSYDNEVLPSVYPQTDKASIPNRNTLVAALDEGVTPITTVNGKALIVRAITTRSLTDTGAADEGTLDVADAVVPDAVRDVIRDYWSNVFVVNNPFLDNDPSNDSALDPPAGTGYPRLWATEVTSLLQDLARENWVTAVEDNPVIADLHPTAPRIVFYAPIVVKPHQHQLEGTIAQTKFARKAA